MKRLSNPWRSATNRLLAIYGAFFAICALVLLTLIYWETSQYLTDEAEHLLGERAEYFASIEPARLRERLESTYEFDLLHINAYGLFDPRGQLIAGNITSVPPGLEPDGHSHIYRERFDGDAGRATSTRILAIRLRNGYLLVLARSAALIDRLHDLISRAIVWGLSLTIVPGLLGGILLSIRPRQRIRGLQAASDRIVTGDLRQRLPVSGRGDELDNLAVIVNRMLDEVERLMFEVKSVSENLAHDLRTPLTHLRGRLHRIQQQTQADDPHLITIDEAVAETDDLLARFSALLRISELKDEHRRAAFADVDLVEILRQVQGLYEPLAEDKAIRFLFEDCAPLQVHGDRYLLIEAFSNLVGNAIKFTPAGGLVMVRVIQDHAGPRVDIDGRLEEDFDDPNAGNRLRLDMLDIVDCIAKGTFVIRDDAAGHIGRWQARVGPNHGNHRDLDIRQYVRRCPQCRQRAKDQDEQRKDNERVQSLQSQPDEPDHGCLLLPGSPATVMECRHTGGARYLASQRRWVPLKSDNA